MNIRNHRWLIFAITAGLFWGIWGVLAKFISEDINPFINHALFTLGMVATLPFVIRNCKWKTFTLPGMGWGVASGLFAISGNMAVYYAFQYGGQASIVIPLTNLYPLITILIAVVFFKEKLYGINIVGLLLAVPAIVLLSGETLLFVNPKAFLASIGFNSWLLFSIGAVCCWGIFSAFQKITTNHISAEWSYTIFVATSLMIALGFFAFGKIDLHVSPRILSLGSLAGMLNGLGVLASFTAYKSKGKASAVTTVAGVLQPVFTIILAVLFLREKFSFIELVGIILAITGALLLSYEKKQASPA